MTARTALVLTLLAGAVSAGAQDAPRARNAAVRDTIQGLADSLEAVGLPAEPLLAKAAEGELKGADDARILRAVRTLARELGEARSALPASSSVGTLVAGASALHAGVRAEDIRRVAADGKAGDGELAVALVTLADLVANKVPASTAIAAISGLMQRHASEADLNMLRLAVAQDVEAGRTPADALRNRARGISDRLTAECGRSCR